MFIAMSGNQDLAPLGAKPPVATGKTIALLRSLRKTKDRQAINISPLRGEATNNLPLHLQVESARFNLFLICPWLVGDRLNQLIV